MAVYTRGGVWWYEFVFGGQRVRESTHHKKKRVAEQIEAAHKTRLAKGEVGIIERKPVPTLREFAPRFEQAIELQCAEKPRTVEFYKAKLKTLLEHDSLSSSRVDTIDESAIEKYTQARGRITSRRKQPLAPGSINRELARLRRLLRLAHEWKVIQRVSPAVARGEKPRVHFEPPAGKALLVRMPRSALRRCDSAT